MKAFILFFALIISIPATLTAQENKTIREETTVKKVVKKEGSQVIVKEVAEIKTEAGEVIVADNEEENQVFSEKSEVKDAEKVMVDETNIDSNNEAMIARMKAKEEEELRKSKMAAMAEAEAQRKMLAEKEAARLKAVEEAQKKLEKRPKGMARLSKKKKGN